MKVFVGLFLAIFVITLGIFLITPSTQGQKKYVDEPTVVQKGQVTEKERAYSKEYKKLYAYRDSRKLSGAVQLSKSKGNTQEVGVTIGLPQTVTVGDTPFPTKMEFLSDLSCGADAVVLGSVKSKSAHMTEDETFVFTEYEFSIRDVLKNNPASRIDINSSIQVTRPGGLISLDGQVIRAEDLSYEALQADKDYLLFLRFVPEANGYIVSSPEGDFLLEQRSTRTLSKTALPDGLAGIDSQSLLNEIRKSMSFGCGKNPIRGDD
jgi:hypothetical protein